MPEPPPLEPLIMLKTMGPVVLDLPPEPPPSFWRTKRFWLVTLALMGGLSTVPLLGLFAAHHTIDLYDLIPAARLIQATPMPSITSTSTAQESTSTEPEHDPDIGRLERGVKLRISAVTVERPIRATVQRAKRRRRRPLPRRSRRRSVDVDAILQAGAQ
jgi:hypothetical protein